jgi:ADP-ribose pyrophosphatase YjhB (NUDIX family)
MDENQAGSSAPAAGDPKWLKWARELHSVAQNGLLYGHDHYDRERYEQVLRIAAEMMATQAGSDDLRPVMDLLTQDNGYLTPKIDVRGVVFRDGKILLVREVQDDGRWSLPGGWADPNDSPARAAEREVKEETGYDVEAKRLLALYDRSHPRHGHQPPAPLYAYKAIFLCDLVGGHPETSIETGESRFFGEDELPLEELSISRVTEPQLRQFFEMVRTGEPAADFD